MPDLLRQVTIFYWGYFWVIWGQLPHLCTPCAIPSHIIFANSWRRSTMIRRVSCDYGDTCHLSQRIYNSTPPRPSTSPPGPDREDCANCIHEHKDLLLFILLSIRVCCVGTRICATIGIKIMARFKYALICVTMRCSLQIVNKQWICFVFRIKWKSENFGLSLWFFDISLSIYFDTKIIDFLKVVGYIFITY